MTASIKVRLKHLVLFAMSLPFISIVLCVWLAICLHLEDATYTHCKVKNYLPTISAAVGGGKPEAYIWRFGIGLHSSMRYLFTVVYYKFYQDALLTSAPKFRVLVKINFMLNVIENTCLLILTCVSSTDNYEVHKFNFIGFLGCSMLYMAHTCYLFLKLGRIRYSKKNYYSLKMKLIFFGLNLLFFLLSMYFFWRHNAYCEPGVYSIFALLEYLVVFTNILFHGTASYDFRDTIIEIPIHGKPSVGGDYWKV